MMWHTIMHRAQGHTPTLILCATAAASCVSWPEQRIMLLMTQMQDAIRVCSSSMHKPTAKSIGCQILHKRLCMHEQPCIRGKGVSAYSSAGVLYFIYMRHLLLLPLLLPLQPQQQQQKHAAATL
jgi:hypothetical protein